MSRPTAVVKSDRRDYLRLRPPLVRSQEAYAQGDEVTMLAILRGTATFYSSSRTEGLAALAQIVEESALAPIEIRAEAAIHYAGALWRERRLDDAERALDSVLDETVDVVHARMLSLIAAIEMSRERYAIAARHFTDALDTLVRSTGHDGHLHAALVRVLADVAVETLDLRLGRRLRRDYESTTWPEALAVHRAAIVLSLGQVAMLEGDLLEAWRLFDESVVNAPSVLCCIRARVALAGLLRVAGDRFGPTRLLEIASREIGTIVWEEAESEDRVTLLEYALEATRVQAMLPKADRSLIASASEALTRYSRLPERAARYPLGDRRSEALAMHLEGIVLAANGDVRTATHQIARALAIWRELGFPLREGQAALDVYRLTGEDRHLAQADTATRTITHSWLRRELDTLRREGSNRARNLTPAERRVMHAICEGKTSRQIAEEFGRSENTIRNQTKRVFATMEVNTRAALVAECARLGLLTTED